MGSEATIGRVKEFGAAVSSPARRSGARWALPGSCATSFSRARLLPTSARMADLTEAWRRHALLSPQQMGEADRLTIAGGTPGIELMENAGRAVADAVARRWSPRPVAVLCGPGNNGGDGFVAARILAERGWKVRLALLGERAALTDDAAAAAGRWTAPVEALGTASLEGAALVVDALFGAGLARPIEGIAREVIAALDARPVPVIAVDVPSGLHGDSGQVLGAAPQAALTVTFFRWKPGHILLPGRELCGEVVVADIGTPTDVLDQIRPQTFVNAPPLWLDHFPWPKSSGHKYQRGHALIVGGAKMTGAARLAAKAASRMTGVVTIACPPPAMPIYAVSLLGILIEPIESSAQFSSLLEDERKTAVLVGPGNGVGERTRACAMAALKSGKPCALDADVFTSFADNPPALISALSAAGTRCVLTPHEGEFARVFDLSGDKLARARAAAKLCGQIVLIKGGDTVVVAPDGRAVINANAPADLATAGAGDVLAGILTGLLASAMPVFEAACAAAWLHGAVAQAAGPGLVAEDLEARLPQVLRGLRVAAGLS